MSETPINLCVKPAGFHSVGEAPSSFSPKHPHTVKAYVRAFHGFLQLFGASDSHWWLARIWSALLFGTITYYSLSLMIESAQQGKNLLAAGAGTIDAAIVSGYFGVHFLLIWLALLSGFLYGSRNLYDALVDAQTLLLEPTPFEHKYDFNSDRRMMWHLLGLVCFTVLVIAAYMAIIAVDYTYASSFLDGMLFALLNVCYLLVPIKFMFLGLLVMAGYRTCNAQLRAIAEGEPTTAAMDQLSSSVRQLGWLQHRLSTCFRRGVSAMWLEIVLVVLLAIMMEVSLLLFVVSLFSTGVSSYLIAILTASLFLASVLPCLGMSETSHRVHALLADGVELLARLQLLQPQLAQEAGAAMVLAQRALESLGHLGLFRLDRALFVSISSTLVTYVIVMQQFR